MRETVLFAASGSSLATEFEVPEHLPPVEFDEGQMRQVFHNLVQNAREAMPGGGVLLVSGRGLQLGEDEIPGLPAGRYLRLDFRDNGNGIDRAHLALIFDPYFSTKEMGPLKGRGLGLAVSYSIVRSHGGAITVDSGLGRGTTVSVLLRASPCAPPAGPQPGAALPPEEPGEPVPVARTLLPEGPPKGRILVMDDEALVLNLAGAALRQLGYEATLYRDGNEAVVRYQVALEAGRPFDAVILDLITVPGGMGGLDAMGRLRRIDPRVRAIQHLHLHASAGVTL